MGEKLGRTKRMGGLLSASQGAADLPRRLNVHVPLAGQPGTTKNGECLNVSSFTSNGEAELGLEPN